MVNDKKKRFSKAYEAVHNTRPEDVASFKSDKRDVHVDIHSDKDVNVPNEITDFLEGHQSKKNTVKVKKGIYFDDDVVDELMRLKERMGPGALSGFVNAATRQAFKDKGFWKE